MVHFDAHPDLACSKSAPAIACFNPRHYCSNCDNGDDDNSSSISSHGNDGNDNDNDNANNPDNARIEENSKNLYELLDLTPSGIAEWILPLVLAAKLSKIEWVKPIFSSQISEGSYQFAVGVEYENRGDDNNNDSKDEITSYLDLPESALVKVDFNHPYYLDDISVVSTDELVLKQDLELRVSELRYLPFKQEERKQVSCGTDGEEKSDTNSEERSRNLWTLDICLDYFACKNPYILDLESRNSLAARAFLNVMESSVFNFNNTVNIDNNKPIISMDYQIEIIRFYNLLKQILLDNLNENITKRRPVIDDSSFTTSSAASFDEISKYFKTAEQAKRLIRQLMIEINDDDNDSALLSSMVIEAIPNWSMPHNKSSTATENIDESCRLVETHIQQHIRDSDQPFLITIARSTLDGFCPPQMVEMLQGRVLDILHRQVCGEHCQSCKADDSLLDGNCCRLLIVRDYGEWEGSVIPYNTERKIGVA